MHERVGGDQVSLKRVKKHLDFVRMKRHETNMVRSVAAKAIRKFGADDLADQVRPMSGMTGHYWVEVGNLSPDRLAWAPSRSYGWWPAKDPTVLRTLAITKPREGVLNDGNERDPHHGEAAKNTFHPVMEVDDDDTYEETRARVEQQMGAFAFNFKGTWNWRLGWGKNCHTFQQRMLDQLGMTKDEKNPDWLQPPLPAALVGRAAWEHRWEPFKGEGNYVWRDGIQADPPATIEEIQALSPEERQEIQELAVATTFDMNEWCRIVLEYKGPPLFT